MLPARNDSNSKLAQDGDLRRKLQELQQVRDRLAALPVVSAPADLHERITADLERQMLLDNGELLHDTNGRNHLALRHALTAAVLLGLAGLIGAIMFKVMSPSEQRGHIPCHRGNRFGRTTAHHGDGCLGRTGPCGHCGEHDPGVVGPAVDLAVDCEIAAPRPGRSAYRHDDAVGSEHAPGRTIERPESRVPADSRRRGHNVGGSAVFARCVQDAVSVAR